MHSGSIKSDIWLWSKYLEAVACGIDLSDEREISAAAPPAATFLQINTICCIPLQMIDLGVGRIMATLLHPGKFNFVPSSKQKI